MTKKRYARILRGCGISESAIELNVALAQSTNTPYADVISAQADTIISYYRFDGTPLPRELRRYEEARA